MSDVEQETIFESYEIEAELKEVGMQFHVLRFKNMDFSDALRVLKRGEKIARKGWNGKNMWLCSVPGQEGAGPDHVFGPQKSIAIKNRGITILPRIDMLTAKGEIQIGWLASQSDILANDWEIIDG